MKPITKILLACLIIFCTVIGIDFIFGAVVNKVFSKSNSTKFDYAMNTQENPELVIFGSSRAENHYDTPFINDSIGITSFNFGEPGRGLTYHDASISSYLLNHHPEMIVLDLLPDDLSGEINNRIKPLYAYIDQYPEIKDVAINVDPLNKYLLDSRLLRYNSEIFDHIKKLRHPYNPQTIGFTPLPTKNAYLNLAEKVYDKIEYEINPIAKQSLINIYNTCNKHNVKLVVAISPEYCIRNYEIPVITICDSLKIPVIDYRNIELNKEANKYFYDYRHLNSIGAWEYTRCFMQELKKEDMSTKHSPKVSVIVPVYNASEYLRKCLDSIIDGELKDIEVIAVDDGSTDNSLSVLREYAERTGIKVISQPNAGPSKARNRGLEIATGEYVGFVDSDDWVEPNMFSEMYGAAKAAGADIVFCNIYRNEDIKLRKYIDSGVYDKSGILQTIFPLLISNIYEKSNKVALRGSTCIKLFARELIEKNHIRFDELLTYNEDGLFSITATLNCKRYVYLGDSYLYHNRYVSGSLTKRYVGNLWNRQKLLGEKLFALTEHFSEFNFKPQIYKKILEIAIYCIENECKPDSPANPDKISRVKRSSQMPICKRQFAILISSF